MKNERSDILKFSFHSSIIMFWLMKSFPTILNYDASGLVQKVGSVLLLPFFPFCVLESELISSKSLFFTILFRASISVKTASNSTKQLYWLFTKEIIALTTLLTSLLQLMFYFRPTVIIRFWCFYLQSFPEKNTFISLSNIASP